MHVRSLILPFALLLGAGAAHAQSNSLFISGNVMTGQTWNAATNAGNGASGSCTTSANIVQYYNAAFFTDTTADSYSLSLYYPSFQSGFVYLYQDGFVPLDPCNGIIAFGYAPIANIMNIHLDANRQYFFVTSEDVLYGGGGAFQVTIDGPTGSHLFLGNAPSPHTPFCFGDGSGTACPCGNDSPVGNRDGCLNSSGQGGRIRAIGRASVANDSLVLLGSQMTNAPALYFEGTTQLNGGNGVVFGDGLRCIGGAIVRLAIHSNAGGSSQYPAAGDPPVSVRGLVPAGGGTFTYQCWYRNADPAFCTASTFNLTNGVQVAWGP